MVSALRAAGRAGGRTLPLVALLSSCALVPTEGAAHCLIDRPAQILSPAQVPAATGTTQAMGLDLTSASRSRVRATVEINGRLAFDGRLPAGGGCANDPVERHRYDVPRGPAAVTVMTDRGESGVVTVPVDGTTRWVVVQVYDGLPLEVRAYDQVPGWG